MSDLPSVDCDPVLESTLVGLGVRWPWHGYAPGGYSVRCHRCPRRHVAAKGSFRCLPCAIKDAAESGEQSAGASYSVGFWAARTVSKSAV